MRAEGTARCTLAHPLLRVTVQLGALSNASGSPHESCNNHARLFPRTAATPVTQALAEGILVELCGDVANYAEAPNCTCVGPVCIDTLNDRHSIAVRTQHGGVKYARTRAASAWWATARIDASMRAAYAHGSLKAPAYTAATSAHGALTARGSLIQLTPPPTPAAPRRRSSRAPPRGVEPPAHLVFSRFTMAVRTCAASCERGTAAATARTWVSSVREGAHMLCAPAEAESGDVLGLPAEESGGRSVRWRTVRIVRRQRTVGKLDSVGAAEVRGANASVVESKGEGGFLFVEVDGGRSVGSSAGSVWVGVGAALLLRARISCMAWAAEKKTSVTRAVNNSLVRISEPENKKAYTNLAKCGHEYVAGTGELSVQRKHLCAATRAFSLQFNLPYLVISNGFRRPPLTSRNQWFKDGIMGSQNEEDLANGMNLKEEPWCRESTRFCC
ncbi:hypothetical protein FB451DRAFT_1189665 [Mycena latifolia]|nr:hypothetical protein FB451DRAFT_1189665 [Mycena latifolia]